MAKYDHGGGCSCGLYAECEPSCEHYRPPHISKGDWIMKQAKEASETNEVIKAIKDKEIKRKVLRVIRDASSRY